MPRFPPLVRGGHGARRECAGQPDLFIHSPHYFREFRGFTGLASIYPISPREKRAPLPPRSHGAGTGLAVNTRGNPTYSLTHPLFPQISRVHGVEMEKPNHSKGKTRPVSPRLCGAGTGLAVNMRGNPTNSLTHPFFRKFRGFTGLRWKSLITQREKRAPFPPVCAGRTRGSVAFLRDRTG